MALDFLVHFNIVILYHELFILDIYIKCCTFLIQISIELLKLFNLIKFIPIYVADISIKKSRPGRKVYQSKGF